MRRTAVALVALLAACGEPGLRQDFAPVAAPPPAAVGDRWTMRVADGFNDRTLQTLRLAVTDVSAAAIKVRVAADPAGRALARVYDAAGNPRTGEFPPGLPASGDWPGIASGAPVQYAPALPLLPFPLAPRQVWQAQVEALEPATGKRVNVLVQGQVLGMGTVTVPAGSFEAVKLQTNLFYQDQATWRSGVTERRIDWYAPELGRVVYTRRDSEYTDHLRSGDVMRGDSRVEELLEAPQRGA